MEELSDASCHALSLVLFLLLAKTVYDNNNVLSLNINNGNNIIAIYGVLTINFHCIGELVCYTSRR